MNKSELQYKRDTGMNSRIGFEITFYHNYRTGDRRYNVDCAINDHFDLSDGIIELPTVEYLKWLEEKVEKQNEL